MNPDTRKRAQTLRKNATKEENKLWYQFLRTYPVQWNRQKVIGGYIVDFYCKKANLVIELDGSQHFQSDSMQYDQARTEYLGGAGIQVIRFTNTDVNQQFASVCKAIELAVKERLR